TADHPERRFGLHRALRRREPAAREGIIAFETLEAVPRLFDAVDARLIGPLQFAFELEIVRWIGEDEIDALGSELAHFDDRVAHNDALGSALTLLDHANRALLRHEGADSPRWGLHASTGNGLTRQHAGAKRGQRFRRRRASKATRTGSKLLR